MQFIPSSSKNSPPKQEAVRVVLHHAKRLHQAAATGSLATALPVLRRILAAKVLEGISLTELNCQRDIVRRKHVLRTLAIEAGHPGWEQYRKALEASSPEKLEIFDIIRPDMGYPNHWFSSLDEARRHAATHGGRPVGVGSQAVVFDAYGCVGRITA